MIHKIGTLRLDLGEILSYYPTEYAIYKQKMVAGNYVAFFMRGAPDIVRYPFDSVEARDEFLTALDEQMKARDLHAQDN